MLGGEEVRVWGRGCVRAEVSSIAKGNRAAASEVRAFLPAFARFVIPPVRNDQEDKKLVDMPAERSRLDFF
jgi:hypothetical protein